MDKMGEEIAVRISPAVLATSSSSSSYKSLLGDWS